MLRGLYTATAGMLAELARQDVVSNNLANANTVAYKRDQAVFRAFPEILLHRINDAQGRLPVPTKPPQVGRLGTGSLVEAVITQHQGGPLQQTEQPFDLAIVGPGFFAVATPQGVAYTRSGNFTRNGAGFLVTQTGLPVLGEDGLVQVSDGEIVITLDGTVMVDGVRQARLQLVNFADPTSLRKQGDNLFMAAAQAEQLPFTGEVRQGYLEQANVNVVQELVELITVTRAYEANQKVVQTYDELLGKAVNEVGRV